MYTEISLQDLKNRRIPPFFADWWKANQQEMKQYLTKHDYDPVADFASEGNLAIGTGSSASIKFNTGGSTAANERMRIDPTGKVGIGITNPAAQI